MYNIYNLPFNFKSAVLLMCGDHGIANHGVSAFSQDVTLQMMVGYSKGVDSEISKYNGQSLSYSGYLT